MDTSTFGMNSRRNIQFEDGIYELSGVTTEHTELLEAMQRSTSDNFPIFDYNQIDQRDDLDHFDGIQNIFPGLEIITVDPNTIYSSDEDDEDEEAEELVDEKNDDMISCNEIGELNANRIRHQTESTSFDLTDMNINFLLNQHDAILFGGDSDNNPSNNFDLASYISDENFTSNLLLSPPPPPRSMVGRAGRINVAQTESKVDKKCVSEKKTDNDRNKKQQQELKVRSHVPKQVQLAKATASKILAVSSIDVANQQQRQSRTTKRKLNILSKEFIDDSSDDDGDVEIQIDVEAVGDSEQEPQHQQNCIARSLQKKMRKEDTDPTWGPERRGNSRVQNEQKRSKIMNKSDAIMIVPDEIPKKDNNSKSKVLSKQNGGLRNIMKLHMMSNCKKSLTKTLATKLQTSSTTASVTRPPIPRSKLQQVNFAQKSGVGRGKDINITAKYYNYTDSSDEDVAAPTNIAPNTVSSCGNRSSSNSSSSSSSSSDNSDSDSNESSSSDDNDMMSPKDFEGGAKTVSDAGLMGRKQLNDGVLTVSHSSTGKTENRIPDEGNMKKAGVSILPNVNVTSNQPHKQIALHQENLSAAKHTITNTSTQFKATHANPIMKSSEAKEMAKKINIDRNQKISSIDTLNGNDDIQSKPKVKTIGATNELVAKFSNQEPLKEFKPNMKSNVSEEMEQKKIIDINEVMNNRRQHRSMVLMGMTNGKLQQKQPRQQNQLQPNCDKTNKHIVKCNSDQQSLLIKVNGPRIGNDEMIEGKCVDVKKLVQNGSPNATAADDCDKLGNDSCNGKESESNTTIDVAVKTDEPMVKKKKLNIHEYLKRKNTTSVTQNETKLGPSIGDKNGLTDNNGQSSVSKPVENVDNSSNETTTNSNGKSLYEEIIIVSIGCNTDISIPEIIDPVPIDTSQIDAKAPVAITKSTVLLSNIQHTIEKATSSTDYGVISSNSLISSIQNVLLKKSTEVISKTSQEKANNQCDAGVEKEEIEHGENKIIMHLPRDRIKIKTGTIAIQTDPYFQFSPLQKFAPLSKSLVKNYEENGRDCKSINNSDSIGIKFTAAKTTKRSYRRNNQTDSSYCSEDERASTSSRKSNSSRYYDDYYRDHDYSKVKHHVRNFSRNRTVSRSLSQSSRSSSASSSSSSSSITAKSLNSYGGSSSKSYYDDGFERQTHSRGRNNYHRSASPEERRIVYVGRLTHETTKEELRRKFMIYGVVKNVSLHLKENKTRYGFITFDRPADAYKAIDSSSTNPELNSYDISFGGRRAFCREKYLDLDNTGDFYRMNTAPIKVEEDTFEILLRELRQKIKD